MLSRPQRSRVIGQVHSTPNPRNKQGTVRSCFYSLQSFVYNVKLNSEKQMRDNCDWICLVDVLVDCVVTDQFFFPLCIVWHLTTNNNWFVLTFFTQCKMSETKFRVSKWQHYWSLEGVTLVHFGSRDTVTRCWSFAMPSHLKLLLTCQQKSQIQILCLVRLRVKYGYEEIE